MEGVTTAIVAFLFVCVIFPHLVKHKSQYYAALACIVVLLLIQALGIAIASEGLRRFVGFVSAILDITAILLLILSCGGLTPHELAGELRGAFEVMRRGSEEKELIIPLTGQQPKARQEPTAPRPTRRSDPSSSIPLD